ARGDFTWSTHRAQDTSQQRREVVAVRLDRGATGHALAQLGAIAERVEQSQMKDNQHQPRVVAGGQVVQAVDERVEDRSILQAILGEQVDHLGQVVGVCGQVQVLTYRTK